MPDNIKQWLHDRGINDRVIEQFHIGYSEQFDEIIIPVFDAQGNHLFNKYRKSPFDESDKPKYRYDKGGTSALYGVQFLKGVAQVFIVEGELDVLVLESRGWHAVSSTGGSASFKEEWASLFSDKVTYIIYDNDKPGFEGALRTQRCIPNAKIIWLPSFVGEHGDITDYFRRGGTLSSFDELVEGATSYNLFDVPEEDLSTKAKRKDFIKALKDQIERTMEEALKLRSDNQSDAHLQCYLQLLNNKYQEQNQLLKKPRRASKGAKGYTGRIAEAKQIPINHYVKFNHQNFARCLWHDEKTASMFWYRKQNRVKCFGCGQLGDVIDVIQQMNNTDLKGALDILVPNKEDHAK